jgi:transcriptional regulator with XRE-family HTH domain
VIDVALLSVIRRWWLRDGLAIREICRRSGLSRNTIRKYLKNQVVEPKYSTPRRASKLDAFEDKLRHWLESEPRKSRKQRRNLRQMTGDLVALGYRGSYDRVAAFARDWRRRQREVAQVAGGGTFVPLVFAPGEAFQFDWSDDCMDAGDRAMQEQLPKIGRLLAASG